MRPFRFVYHSAVYVAYRVGVRGYCWPCDDSRWAWTHRRCQRRHDEIAFALRGTVERMVSEGRWPPAA